jgi:hypothetical protein
MHELTASSYQSVTLAIAVVGLALAVASLTWQAVTFILTGSRVKAYLRYGAHDGFGGVVSAPPGASLDQLAQQGFGHEVLGVEVRNVGRLAVNVDKVEAVLDNGVRYSEFAPSLGPSLPHRLDAQSSQSWFMPMQPTRAAIRASSQTFGHASRMGVRVSVALGNGKVVVTKDRLLVDGA